MNILETFLTAETGEKRARHSGLRAANAGDCTAEIRVRPDRIKQTIEGIGSSLTESSAFVLAHLSPEQRRAVMRKAFGVDGANFTMGRTPIGACDFCVAGRYSCADVPGDYDLRHFSIDCHKRGFDSAEHPGIRDPAFSLVAMLKEVLAVKRSQSDPTFKIIASAWTAPAWMKDIDDWYIPGSAENRWQGTGGSLLPENFAVYADYLLRFLAAYHAEGIDLWGVTPVNEPCGNNGQWESMHFTPDSQNAFIKHHLGPQLRQSPYRDVKLLVFDQNRDAMETWADVIFGDPVTAELSDGLAVHWYSSTFRVYEEIFQRIKQKYPQKLILHTEGCIDDLGKEAPAGVTDPQRFKESGWFANDTFWWNQNATDWAYSTTWDGVDAADHPIYTPVHRYARDIIVGLNNGLNGWIDWNLILDRHGGPNHVGNYCGAPIMIDTASGDIHYTPIFHILAQFSQTIRPGDRAVQVETLGSPPDALHACATRNDDNLLTVQILNTTKHPLTCRLQMDEQSAKVAMPANALQTIRIGCGKSITQG